VKITSKPQQNQLKGADENLVLDTDFSKIHKQIRKFPETFIQATQLGGCEPINEPPPSTANPQN